MCGLTKILCGLNARWSGCSPEDKQRVYFANHASHMDFLVIWSSLPDSLRRKTRPVAGKDYWDCGPIRRYVARKVINAVLIDRKCVKIHDGDHHPIEMMAQALDEGHSLILFPEGTRNVCDDDIQEFKSGLYHLALKCPQVELIPVYLENLSRILPKGEYLPLPLLGSVIFGAAIHLEESETKHAFLARARSAIERLRDE